MEKETYTVTELIPRAIQRVEAKLAEMKSLPAEKHEQLPQALQNFYAELDELRILVLLEESEREAAKGVWHTHEEVFSAVRENLHKRRSTAPADESGVRARAV